VSAAPAAPRDFARHNEEVRLVWESYDAGRPVRVPFGRLTIGPRIWVLDPALNTSGVTWEAMSNDPRLMFDTYLSYKHHLVHRVPHDIEMGVPSGAWEVCTEFVNVTEEAWLGCDLAYPEGQVTATVPRYAGDRKNEIFDRGIPGPFEGILGRVREYHEYYVHRARTEEFHGRPVKVLPPCPVGTDGLFTVAVGIRGPEVLEDMIADEPYFDRSMELITTAITGKIRAWRAWLGMDARPARGGYADDAIQFISTDLYRMKVLPWQKRFFAELHGPGPHAMHLCGDVQRHLPTIVRELDVKSFDTGYPIDFARLRAEIGDDVEIQGGVKVTDLVSGTPAGIRAKAREILASGIMRGGRFVMKEANNMPPRTPAANVAALYEAVREYGRYGG